ncbi:MAG TPA: hypothetical protein VNG04_04365 [Candidatus Acidoferrum sp.]|nr:hypothetical protein [Candidatus Acidoferrum sp.]
MSAAEGKFAASSHSAGIAEGMLHYFRGISEARVPVKKDPEPDTTAPIDPATRQSVRSRLRLEKP